MKVCESQVELRLALLSAKVPGPCVRRELKI
jgi:hypothetical protein